MKPKLILVGGFLGAGKTTLLWQAAAELVRHGKRVGLITNDQAPQLVDTGFLAQHGFSVAEIAGGCFCCRFQDLVRSAGKLIEENQPDVIIGEPVGSCTDISATVLQPIKDQLSEDFDVVPFSVMIAPNRLAEILRPDGESRLHESARYIIKKQLEEADRILINKIDLLGPAERTALEKETAAQHPHAPIHLLSALGGRGVAAWLTDILRPGQAAGQRIAEVDYDTYAEGEAVLGWLNATAQLAAGAAVDWQTWSLGLIASIHEALKARQAEIAHLKLLLSTSRGFHMANITHLDGEPVVQGMIGGEPRAAQLVVNARVEITPEVLKEIIDGAIRAAAAEPISLEKLELQSLSPARPEPVHRYTRVV